MSAARRRGAWTPAKRAYLRPILAIIEELESWWPLTLRQVYYRLVAGQVIENRDCAYKKLSRVLTHARLDGLVPWDSIEDRGRRCLESSGWLDAASFVDDERSQLLLGYRRDLLARQPYAVEVWIEKDALAQVAHRAALELCVPVVVARGFVSVSFLNALHQRIQRNARLGHVATRMLYFGDLDPSGWAMLPAMLRTLREEMHVAQEFEALRCALTPDQVVAWHLPYSVEALKVSDSRAAPYRAWLREQGYDDAMAVELDAVPPADLERLVAQAITASLDTTILDADRRAERAENLQLAELRARAAAALSGEPR